MRIRISMIYILLVVSVILTVLNAAITYDNIREKEDATAQIVHSYKIIQSSTQLLSLFMEVETSQRGYIITRDYVFLDSYRQATRMVHAEIEKLSRLINTANIGDHPEESLLKIAFEKQRDLEFTLTTFENYGKDSAVHLMASHQGKEKLDRVRFIVNQIVDNERERLGRQNAMLEENKKLDPVRFSGFALTCMTCMVAFGTIVRKDKSNGRLLKKLRQSNRELENMVEKRTKQLVVANQAKDHFLGVTTHDLKAPINGILGLVGLMRYEHDVASRTDYLNHIDDSCRKMQRLIGDLLEINRIDQGLANISKESVDLKSFLTKIEMEFLSQAEKKGITLMVNKVAASVHTDPDALSRILENLVSNALKFSPAHRSVQLITSRVESHIRFDVKDEGPGIAEHELPKLFGKFQRLANRPTDKESSTGLGLSIVKELTGLLGGTVSVKSELGVGTIFTVCIPALSAS